VDRFPRKIQVVLSGEAVDVDPEAKRFFARWPAFEYDLLADCGDGHAYVYYGNDSWAWSGRRAPEVPSRPTALRHKILYAFERRRARRTPEEARAWLTFVIVGPGATMGSTFRGALAKKNEMLEISSAARFSKLIHKGGRIIFDGRSDISCAPFPEIFRSAKAEKLVTASVWEVIKVVMVTKIDGGGRHGFSAEIRVLFCSAKTVIWAVGVNGHDLWQETCRAHESGNGPELRLKTNVTGT